MCIRRIITVAAAIVAFGALSTADAGAPAPVRTKRIVTGLNFPTFVTYAPGDANHLFVLEKRGVIKIIDLTTNTILPTPFLDIDSLVVGGASANDEQGLLGLAFHPDYQNNGYFWVYYTSVAGAGDDTVRRYKVSRGDPLVADAASGLTIFTWDDPFTNHNGGWMGFGPDGYMYIAVGDGGSANDPGNRAQTIVNMKLGKIHRIIPDIVDSVAPHYTAPADNPFVGITGDDEIWSYGMRNPWRCSFDRQTGDFWIADVGQDAVEELDFQPAGVPGGRNYGWRCTEGTTCTGLTGCTCNGPTLTAPIKTYNHVAGTSGGFCVIGGYVYRGCAYPDLDATYFYADYNSNNVWSMRFDGTTISDFTVRNSQISPSIDGFTVNQVVSFGEDFNGEMYLVDHGSTTTGQIFKIIPSAGEVACALPCPTDLNADGTTDAADLALLLGGWGSSTTPYDQNGDGTIDAADLAIILGAWGDCP